MILSLRASAHARAGDGTVLCEAGRVGLVREWSLILEQNQIYHSQLDVSFDMTLSVLSP